MGTIKTNLSARTISEMLAKRVHEVAPMLYPNGKKDGREWRLGGVAGEAGQSMAVRLDGPKAGLWCDFAGDEGGDLLDLWKVSKGIGLGQAIREAKEFLGIEPMGFANAHEKKFVRPNLSELKKIEEETIVRDYLVSRFLSETIIRRFKLATTDGKHGPEYVFQYVNRDGEVVLLKHVAVKRDERGKKIVRSSQDGESILYGWHALMTDERKIIITEGEIDAMSWAQYGFHALSVPSGAKGTTWIEREWENLHQFDEIYINFDSDKEGIEGAKEVSSRLGKHRCRFVQLPFKDANECLMNGVNGEDMLSCLELSQFDNIPEIGTTTDYSQLVRSYLNGTEDTRGFAPRIFERNICFGKGELTIWSGRTGDGKTTLLNYLMYQCIRFHDEKVAIASMEIKPKVTLGNIYRQVSGLFAPDERDIQMCEDALAGRIFVFNLYGAIPTQKIMECMDYCHARYGVTQFVIDSLMKLTMAGDDYDGQRMFMNELIQFAQSRESHVHMVVHPAKVQDDVSLSNIRGSGDITNQADNIVIVKRNRENKPGAHVAVKCVKQRESGWEGVIPLYFDVPSRQYRINSEDKPQRYIPT